MDSFHKKLLDDAMNEFGDLQQAIDAGHQTLMTAQPRLLELLRDLKDLLPPGNDHIWDGVGSWINGKFAEALHHHGAPAAAEWRTFLSSFMRIREQ